MLEVIELGHQLRALQSGENRFRILDVEHSANLTRAIGNFTHWGVFYLLPPEGATAEQVRDLFEAFKEREKLHFSYNLQGTLGVEHAPLLTTDIFAFKHFEKPARKMVKVQWAHRMGLAALQEILGALREPFNPDTFPHIGGIRLSDYKPPAEGRMTLVALLPVHDRWRTVTDLEDSIRIHIAEANLPREIFVGRHQVKGANREVLLTSTEDTTEFGHKFLSDLADYLTAHPVAVSDASPEEAVDHALASAQNYLTLKDVYRPKQVERSAEELHRQVLETLTGTLGAMQGFSGQVRGIRGSFLEINYPGKGLLGLGGHFDDGQATVLRAALKVVRASPGLYEGWSAQYRYDRGERVLRVRACAADEKLQDGYTAAT